MYYKISNQLDVRCLYHWLSESQGRENLERLRPVIEALSFSVDTLVEAYKGNHCSDYRGGYVAFFEKPIREDNTYLRELLDYYNLDAEEYEYRDILCSYQTEEHTKVEWISNLFIMADFQLIIIYPMVKGGV